MSFPLLVSTSAALVSSGITSASLVVILILIRTISIAIKHIMMIDPSKVAHHPDRPLIIELLPSFLLISRQLRLKNSEIVSKLLLKSCLSQFATETFTQRSLPALC